MCIVHRIIVTIEMQLAISFACNDRDKCIMTYVSKASNHLNERTLMFK